MRLAELTFPARRSCFGARVAQPGRRVDCNLLMAMEQQGAQIEPNQQFIGESCSLCQHLQLRNFNAIVAILLSLEYDFFAYKSRLFGTHIV